jgi:hypothetical protein
MKIIQTLSGHPMTDRDGNCYGIQPPTNSEMMDKINELVEAVNNLQQDIDYLKDQDTKRKKYEVIRRYDVLLLAKQKMESGEFSGLCNAISASLSEYDLWCPTNRLDDYFLLYNRDQALKFGASKSGNFWWKAYKFGKLSGRRRYLNWLIREYKDDQEILKTIEIYG